MQGMGSQQQPIIVLNVGAKREHGRTAQLSNIKAAKVNILILLIKNLGCKRCH
jgi:hypothetical protein